MRTQTVILVTVMALCLSTAAQAKYSGGTGEPNDPYIIATAEDMNAIGADSNDWDAHFLLVADINLADYAGTQFNIIGYYISPSNKNPFTGVFDGNDHKIWNFTWISTGRDCIGLFGWVDSGGQIKNLGIENVDVNAGTSGNIGGLVGWNGNGTIKNCYSTGNVTGDNYIGALVGWNHKGTIANCHSSCSVSGDFCVGGLAGGNFGAISDCYANGGIAGDELVGGLVSVNGDTITNCYFSGSVIGIREIGGLVGQNDEFGTISNCYSTGNVNGTGDYVGGLVGYSYYGSVTASFWDIETSGLESSDGGEGKTTVEMKMENTFTDAGWDFIEIWNIGENQTYPFLRVYPAGDINHDDIVNLYDFAILADHWLQ